MKIDEIRGKPDAELRTLVPETREALFKLRFAATTEPIDNPGKIRDLRRRVAQLEGEIRARELKELKEKMVSFVKGGERTAREIANGLGLSIEAARREARRLERAGLLRETRHAASRSRAWTVKGA
jgi:large subunit ribosomal protein L29